MAKQEVVVVAIEINMNMNKLVAASLLFFVFAGYGQDTTQVYKKRVLEYTEVDFLSSYYSQDGNNAAVSGGRGNEELTDFTATYVISIPLNDDDILSIDAGISAYTSASTSNINPWDGDGAGDAFVASSGESTSDSWKNITGSYSHSSDDRNEIWSAKLSLSKEYDYFSFGVGGGYTKLFNEKNTELSVNANIYLDSWTLLYPVELSAPGPDEDDDFDITQFTITGNTAYNPAFTPIGSEGRNSYSVGFGFSQILTKKMQGSLALDFVQQEGLLSTPFQRVYFGDVEDSFIQNFHLADDIERLPDTRFKVAVGGRLNYYINQTFVLRTYYRYYTDDWGISSNTVNVELPIKLLDKFTVYPSYRYYDQTAADYFAGYEQHLSTEEFYTSDYDLSDYSANQFGFGITYTDIFTERRVFKFGLKSIDLKYNTYKRDSGLNANIISVAFKFVKD